uniref:Mitochondrial import inner membrane translocase subunit n=1 Tax=Oryza rufipogon TaxID=4529 RepID=A0A0E0N784_ORYRU
MSSVVVASTPTVLPLQSRPATHSRSSGKTLLLGPSPLPHPASATQGHMVRGVCSGQDFHFCIDEQTQGCIARFQAGSSLSGSESSCISRCVDHYIEATGIVSRALFSTTR